jgi:hypothetical protein
MLVRSVTEVEVSVASVVGMGELVVTRWVDVVCGIVCGVVVKEFSVVVVGSGALPVQICAAMSVRIIWGNK